MFNKTINYLLNPNNWCEPEDRAFYKLYLWFTLVTSYILVGAYYYDQELLRMFFWPLHYGYFGH